MPEPPFTRLSTEVLIDNPWHSYKLDRYTQTDGSEGQYYYVDMAGSCGIIPRFDDGSTVLLHCHRYLLDTTLWEFPIGGMRPGEDPLAIAKKELLEEAGLLATSWQALGSFAPYKGVSNERCHFFLAEGLSWTKQQLEPSEQISVHQMSMDEARDRILDQDLPDGQSLAGLMLFDRTQR